MATAGDWIEGARLRTLPAAAAPVILGCGAAWGLGDFSWLRGILALVTALALQIGANYSNDYSDGIRGTDNEDRVGPQRLTGPGLAKPKTVLGAALGSWAVAAIAGFALVWISHSWWLLLFGALAFVAAWFYTGGKNPYGYRPGVAEVMVFVFFGLFATVGTTWTQVHMAPWQVWVAAAGVGILSCALLLINNLRDIDSDAASDKRTLCVAMGDTKSRRLFEVYMVVASLCGFLSVNHALGYVFVAIIVIAAFVINVPVRRGATGVELITVLKRTGLLTLLYGVLIGIGMAMNVPA